MFRRLCGKVRGRSIIGTGGEESVDINDVLKEAPLRLRLGVNLGLSLLLLLRAGFKLVAGLNGRLLTRLHFDLSELDILGSLGRILQLRCGMLLKG